MVKGFCLNELQQIVEVQVKEDKDKQGVWVIQDGDLKGNKISQDFFYQDAEQANQEIAERHQRLHKAFKNLDLLSCLSINKEPSRKLLGLSKSDLDKLAAQDKKDYKRWLTSLEKGWEEINHERPDLEKLSKTLKNANLIQKALESPLAIEFIEIMSREAKIKKAGKEIRGSNPEEPITPR